LREVTERRIRSTLDVLSAQPSATSPEEAVVLNTTLTLEISGSRSGSPEGGGTHVHWAVHWPLAQPLACVPSHCSSPSRTLLPQTLGGVTVSVKVPDLVL
jgi:hypothetical protein